jgi:hypothetical protein
MVRFTLTIELLEAEFKRVSEILGSDYFTLRQYTDHVKNGYHAWGIKRQLGMSFNDAKRKFGYPIARTGFQQGIARNKTVVAGQPKVFCKRDTGSMIRVSDCIPGCNDVCKVCPHPNESNRVGGNLAKEEEADIRYDNNTQSGYGVAYGNWDK